VSSPPHGGTLLGAAVETMNERVPHDRLIVVSDEQSRDRVPDPVARFAYVVRNQPRARLEPASRAYKTPRGVELRAPAAR